MSRIAKGYRRNSKRVYKGADRGRRMLLMGTVATRGSCRGGALERRAKGWGLGHRRFEYMGVGCRALHVAGLASEVQAPSGETRVQHLAFVVEVRQVFEDGLFALNCEEGTAIQVFERFVVVCREWCFDPESDRSLLARRHFVRDARTELVVREPSQSSTLHWQYRFGSPCGPTSSLCEG